MGGESSGFAGMSTVTQGSGLCMLLFLVSIDEVSAVRNIYGKCVIGHLVNDILTCPTKKVLLRENMLRESAKGE